MGEKRRLEEVADSKKKGESDGENETEWKREGGRLETRDARAKEGAKGREKCDEEDGGVRPELDRIGELVITEAGDSPGMSAGLPRAST